MKNALKILELAWLVIAIVCFLIAIYQTFLLGFKQSWYLFIFTFVAALMYTVRKRQRMKHEKSNHQ